MKAQTRFWKAVDRVEQPIRALGCFPSAVLAAATAAVVGELLAGPGAAATAYAAVVGLLGVLVGRTWRDDRAARTREDLEKARHLLDVHATDSQQTTAMPTLPGDAELTRPLLTIKPREDDR